MWINQVTVDQAHDVKLKKKKSSVKAQGDFKENCLTHTFPDWKILFCIYISKPTACAKILKLMECKLILIVSRKESQVQIGET